jgi:hypothetical protein
MKTLPKSLIIASAVIFMLSAVAAPAPRHPLSQITPVDTDLDMEDYAINNLSEISLNNGVGNTGLVLDNYEITDEGRSQSITLDYQNDEWDIENSDLNLNSNELQDSQGPITLGGGEVEIPDGNLQVANNREFIFGSVGGAGLIYDSSPNFPNSPSTMETVALTGGGSRPVSVYIEGNNPDDKFRVMYDSATSGAKPDQVGLSVDGNGNAAVPNGNLDVSGQLSVGSTECGSNQFVNGNGNCVTDDTGTDNQNLGSSRSGDTVSISIDDGSGTSFTDNYEANTDNQDLSNVVGQGNSLSSGQTLDASSGAFRLPVGTDAY